MKPTKHDEHVASLCWEVHRQHQHLAAALYRLEWQAGLYDDAELGRHRVIERYERRALRLLNALSSSDIQPEGE